ncbi:MAG: VWA domain-containing protein [Atopobiaceae bacterium]|nr:VWA domain-containing protein [Atopobiaceae bacterium]
MKKTLEWTHPALHLVQKALVAAVAIIAAVGLFALPVTAYAEDAPVTDLTTAPAHKKTATDNGDGTYKITLSVTGNSVQSTTTSHADVIVVMDTSYSMNYSQRGDYIDYYRPSRLSVAKDAVNSLAEKLLANNTDDNPDAVRISLVTFGGYATTSKSFTTDLQGFQTTVTGLKTGSSREATGGTNWEDGLTVANQMATRDANQTYIIFVSDGNPTYRNTRGGNQSYWEDARHEIDNHVIYGSGNSDDNGKNYKYASQVAQSINGAGKKLFSVGVFGNVSKMQDLASDAGQVGNYYSASDQDTLNSAFENIVNTITTNISYTNVVIEDTLNSGYVDYVLPDDAEAPAFSYSYTKNGQPYTPADTIPVASFAGGKVTWNLGSIELEKGVTYAVSFDVKLKQEAYDEAAKAEGDFKVDTNGAGTLSYQKITHVTGQDPVYSGTATLEYEKPQVTVPVSTLTVSKKWNLNGGTAPESLAVKVLQDSKEYKTVTLDAAHGWTANVKVAAGPRGHEYSVTEECGDEWLQSLPDAVKLTGLVTQTGTQEITNTYKTGTLTLTKNLKGNAANVGDHFEFTLICDGLADGTYGDVTFTGGKATVSLQNGDTKTLNNLPAGKTITITETASDKNQALTTTTATVKIDNSTPTKSAGTSVDAPIEYEKTTAVTYTNKTEIAPDTGLDFSTTSQGVLLGVAAAGAATLSIAAIRKNHGERKEK